MPCKGCRMKVGTMKKLLIPVILLAAAILTGLLFFSDPNIVDQDYISSKKYEELEDKLEKSKSENKSQEWVLKQFALKLSRNSNNYRRELPIRLDSVSVDSILSLNKKINLGDNYTGQQFSINNNYYGVLVFEEGGIKSVFLLMESKGLYKDIDILLATISDSKVVDLESIGSFGKNISEETTSIIHIGKNNLIRTTVNRKRFYPVSQQNESNYIYKIKPDGYISSQILSQS